jgi:hypothetical protein
VAEVECPSCGSAELDLVEVLRDERRRIACSVCGHEWLRGEAKRVYRSTTTIDDLRGKFPTPADVLPANLQRAETLKAQFLKANPESKWSTTVFRKRYRQLFSETGLPTASP